MDGEEVLPIAETVRATGYLALVKSYDGEVYLRPDPQRSPKAEAVRKSLLGRP